MPLTSCTQPKSEEPPSIESILAEDSKKIVQKSSPKSDGYCEYNTDKSSGGLDNQQPRTPMSALSNSMDHCDASLSDTDFSQLSDFNVDFLDSIDKLAQEPKPFEEDTSDLFNEDTLFHTLDNDADLLKNDAIDPLEIGRLSNALNEKTLFNSLDNTGVCLHINSTRVSLEYCSVCHLNSLNSQIA